MTKMSAVSYESACYLQTEVCSLAMFDSPGMYQILKGLTSYLIWKFIEIFATFLVINIGFHMLSICTYILLYIICTMKQNKKVLGKEIVGNEQLL